MPHIGMLCALCLDDAVAEALGMTDLQPDVSQLMVPVHHNQKWLLNVTPGPKSEENIDASTGGDPAFSRLENEARDVVL
ncbi:hypothetical protein Tco_0156755 [Tanacetum coccineum]